MLTILYPSGLPARLFWLVDSTLTEKPFVRRVVSVDLFHRAKRIVGQAKHLQSQCYVFAAHLYQTAQRQWASALVGALASPALVIPSNRRRSPLEFSLGVRPR